MEEISLKSIIGENLLNKIQGAYLQYLESSAAIYEANGDYAAALFTSRWCDFLNQASKKLAGNVSENEALKSGRWICHEDCWATSLKSIKDKKFCEMECSGGIKIFAAPIIVGGMAIGSNNAGVSNPPTDKEKVKEIAEKYKVDPKELLKIAGEYTPRPEYVFSAARNHVLVAADTIADILLRKEKEGLLKIRTEEAEALNEKLKRTNEELESTAEELRVANEETRKAKEAAEKRAEQLEWFNRIAVDRELKMKELKEKIAQLEEKLKEKG